MVKKKGLEQVYQLLDKIVNVFLPQLAAEELSPQVVSKIAKYTSQAMRFSIFESLNIPPEAKETVQEEGQSERETMVKPVLEEPPVQDSIEPLVEPAQEIISELKEQIEEPVREEAPSPATEEPQSQELPRRRKQIQKPSLIEDTVDSFKKKLLSKRRKKQ